jgi:YD repeat-containing protein
MTEGKNRIMIFGPKADGTFVVEFRTAKSEVLAISIPSGETAVLLLLAAIMLIMLTLIGIVHASAETQRTFYNDKGQVTGQATTRGNTTTFSNDRGQATGRAERRSDGVTNFYDDKGRMIGSSEIENG